MDAKITPITTDVSVSDITLSAVWFYSTPFVLAITILLMAPLVIGTFRANNKARWKTLWNGAELVWIAVAGLSIFTAITSAWLPTRDAYIGALMRMADENFKDASMLSETLLGQNCPSNDLRPACVALAKIRQLSNREDFAATGRLWNEFAFASDLLDASDPIRHYRGNIMFSLGEVRDAAREAAYERGRKFSTDGVSDWIKYLWPQIFAFGFGIRFARAIAVFAL